MDVKKPTSYEEQVDLIKEKGFIITDTDECIKFLNQANYYRLSAYYLPFRNPDKSYITDIHFSRIQRIYGFDSEIRSILFKAIEKIEFYLRTQISYYIAHTYGPLGYLDDSIFNNHHDSTSYQSRIDECIRENRNTAVVQHHESKYDGQFPIWVIIEFFSMGMLSRLYSDLKSKDQKAIARTAFNTTATCLKSWLRCLTDLRNRCAHYSRIYYWTFPSFPKMPEGFNKELNEKLFSQIIMLKFLYPDKDEWSSQIAPAISSLIKDYSDSISLEHIGFPEDWKELL